MFTFEESKKAFKVIKKALKISGWIIVVLLLLLFSAYLAFRSNKVQTYLTQKISTYIAENYGFTLSIGGVDIKLIKSIQLEDVYISDHYNDTLLYLSELNCDLEKYNIDSMVFNLNSVELVHGKFYLKQYQGEDQLNISKVLSNFKTESKSKTDSSKFLVSCGSLRLNDIRFKYDDDNKPQQLYGIDFSHLLVADLNASIHDASIDQNNTHAVVDLLQFNEKSGFVLDKLQGKAIVNSKSISFKEAEIYTNQSEINGDIQLKYRQYSDFSNFVEHVILSLKLKPSNVNMHDIAFFAPELKGVNNLVKIQGNIKGSISNLRGKNVNMSFGDKSNLTGNFVITGLPDINSTFFLLEKIHLNTNKKDIEKLPAPPFNEVHNIKVVDNISKLGNINFKGNFTGFINDFVVDGKLVSEIGSISSDIKFSEDTVSKYSNYSGSLKINEFDLGKFYDEKLLGKVTLKADIDGSGLTLEQALLDIQAEVEHIDLKNYRYNDIELNGKISKQLFDGTLKVKDENIDLDFYGSIDLANKVPEYFFEASLKNTDLTAIGLALKDRKEKISFEIKTNLVGNNIDNIDGIVKLESFEYIAELDTFFLNQLEFYASSDKANNHDIQLKSEILDLNLKGMFKKDELLRSTEGILHQILPSYFPEEKRYTKQEFDYSLTLHNTSKISQLVLPEITFNKPLSVVGHFSSIDSSFSANVNCSDASVYGVNYKDVEMKCLVENDVLNYDINVLSCSTTDSLHLDNIELVGKIVNDNVQYDLLWKNNDTLGFYGNFNGFFRVDAKSDFQLNILEGLFAINNSNWTLSNNNSIEIDTNKIAINQFFFSNGIQELGVSGTISHLTKDTLSLYFKDLNLKLFEPVFKQLNVSVGGVINGKATVSDIYNNLAFGSSIDFDSLLVNNDSLGQGKIHTRWDKQKKTINLIGYLGDVFAFNGYYKPELEKDNLNAQLTIKNLDVSFVEKLTDEILSDVKGTLNGQLNIYGELLVPKIKGELNLSNGAFKVDYLNTYYTIDEEVVIIEEDWIGFNIMEIVDENGNKALANGTIIHDNFSDMNFDFTIATNNFLCLNTTEENNPDYYGTAIATGDINISGFADKLIMDLTIKTEKGSRFFIPLEGAKEVSEIEYIKFVSHDTTLLENEYKVDLSGIQMNFDLDVSRETEVQIIFDEEAGDIIKARGNGDITMEINTSGNFNIYGNYEIIEGDYLFTLQNLLSKKFNLASGGIISWSGDPYSGVMDVDAVYQLRAPLRDLGIPGIDTTGKRVPVDCYLSLTGNVMNPDIEFNLNMPSLRSDDNTAIKSAINNNEAMNKEVFSLLLLNRFVPVNQGAGFTAGGVGGKSSSEMLSNQLSNWLSKISDDFDVGLNYRPGDEVSSREMQVALSTQLFNDRVSVETNLGVAGNNGTNTNSNNIAGDFTIEYKVSKDGRIRAKVYNESNDASNITSNNAKYTQGAAVFYQEEFNTFGEFFRKLFGLKKED